MIYLNQTLIKQLTVAKPDAPTHCPLQVKECMLKDSQLSTKTSDAMNKGIIFESLALDIPAAHGATIPFLKDGKNIPVDYKRIQEQALRFKNEVCKEYAIEVKEKQLYIEAKWNEEVTLFGTLDFTGTIRDNEGVVGDAIVDLKMTGSIYSQYGDFSWAFPFNMDHTQAYMYNWLYKEKYGIDLPFYYLVFDYAPEMNLKVIRKRIEPINKAEFTESVRKAVEIITFYNENGWNANPSYEKCKNCPLKENGTCKQFIQYKPIEEV